ncbi:MAG TPA: glycoside hydrolase family 127 protein [Polyangiaceae bacterium]|nr:glycoside hydrolase family 127 protein [Polyangiaceae bacterium]
MASEHGGSLTRRALLQSLSLGALVPRLAEAASTEGARLFALADVRLTAGPFAASATLNRRYLEAHDVDRLLAGFRSEAGLAPRAAKYPNWESMGLDGHTAGHYLTALAQQAATGNAALRQRLDYMVAELDACQRAQGDGYVGAVPNGRALWREVGAGRIDASGFSLKSAWVPFYNVHKTFAGLRDAWLIAGNMQARDVLVRLADWCGALVAGLGDEQVQTILTAEHGGMNEVLADVYAITGAPRHLALARRFSHRALLEPLLRRADSLDGLHANTQIPKVIGFARIGELGGDRRWVDAAAFFWDTVTRRRSVAFGGNSVREHFNPVRDFSSMLESREGPETCNTYNMLRLTALLYRLKPEARLADYYERAQFNHILSSQHPGHGGLVYFTPIRPRHYRVYSQPGQCFWCCVGSGMESHGKHAQFIYAHDDASLSVNLFIASELRWRERGLTLRQETAFPDVESTSLSLQLDQPRAFALRVRCPEWLAGPLRIQLNGRDWPVRSSPASFARIERTWNDGDRLDIALPMRTHVEPLPDGSDAVAVLRGPIVLAAPTGNEALDGLIADDGRGSHIAPGPYLPLEQAPMLIGAREQLAKHVVPVAGQPLTFRIDGAIEPAAFRQLELRPLFRTHDARYMVYWRTASRAGYPALLAQIEAHERERQALDERTLDRVTPGEQQPEVEHAFQGEDTRTGFHLGRHYRETGRFIGYRLRAPARAAAKAASPLELQLTFWGADRCDDLRLSVGERELAVLTLDGQRPDEFIQRTIVVPAELAARARDGLGVKLIAGSGRCARLFELRLLEPR